MGVFGCFGSPRSSVIAAHVSGRCERGEPPDRPRSGLPGLGAGDGLQRSVGHQSSPDRRDRCHRAVEFRKFLDLLEQTVPAELEMHLLLDNYAARPPLRLAHPAQPATLQSERRLWLNDAGLPCPGLCTSGAAGSSASSAARTLARPSCKGPASVAKRRDHSSRFWGRRCERVAATGLASAL